MSLLILAGQMYGVNASNKLVICSFFFTLTLILLIAITEIWGKKTALWGACSCIILTLLLYSISIQWMHIFSYFGLFFAIYVSIFLVGVLKSRVPLPMTLFLSLSCGILVDAVVICPWVFAIFPIDKAWNVMLRSLLYKYSYTAIFSLCYFLGSSWMQRKKERIG